ncbi:MAG: glycosyltransferase family 2 protein [Planctomycetota bacterium]
MSEAMPEGTQRVGPVSAVVVNHDGKRYLTACLEALSELELDEILVVDNASTDGSLELLAQQHPAVRVVRLEENHGPAAARNAGMRAARNRWVLALDNDVTVTPDVLTRLRAAAEAHPAAVLLQPRSVFASQPDRVHYDGGALHYAGLIALRNFYRPLGEAAGQGATPVDVAISLCLLLDKEIVLEVGGYDDRFFILFEDLDLSCRLRLAGHGILVVEDAVVRHDAGTPGLSFREGARYPKSRIFYHSRNRWLFLLQCPRLWTLVLAAPGLLLYEVAWLAFAVTRGGTRAWLAGKWAVLRGLPETLARRRVVQRTRVRGDRGLWVGGPLTLTPALRGGKLSGLAARVLDACLRGWWGLARHLVR